MNFINVAILQNFQFSDSFLVDGNYTNSYWLGGVDFFSKFTITIACFIKFYFLAEGTWQWVSGEAWGFETWHEGEPNNVDNEVISKIS